MNEALIVQLDPPRFEDGKPLRIAGLRERYTAETMMGVPAQWQRFAPYIGNIPGQVGRATYGLCFDDADGFGYLSGVEVSGSSPLPDRLIRVSVPAQKYAIFPHRGHVSTLRNTVDAIYSKWLPQSGHDVARTAADAPLFFERYGEEFDPRTGTGGMEIWMPIKA